MTAYDLHQGNDVSSDPEFDELKREFLTEAREKIREVVGLFEQDGATRPETRQRMIYLVHQLKGAGGSYGYPFISSDAEALELALEKTDEKGSADSHKQIESPLRSLEQAVEAKLRELGAA